MKSSRDDLPPPPVRIAKCNRQPLWAEILIPENPAQAGPRLDPVHLRKEANFGEVLDIIRR
jgi:hypothetical protein